jgi:hypothetical protein
VKKPIVGLLLGGLLGVLDGLSALLSGPEVAPQITSIVIGSTLKGLLTGWLIGVFAQKVNSLAMGILFGLGVGLLLSFAVAAMPSPGGKHYYWEIMLPGGILGIVVGYATRRYGRRASQLEGGQRTP